MASRRRLDISSLLCDDEQASPSRPVSRSPVVHSPIHHQVHPLGAGSRPYSSSERDVPASTSIPHGDHRYEHEQEHEQQRPHDTQLSPTLAQSTRSLPSSAVLSQSSPTNHRRNPSSPYILPLNSPGNDSLGGSLRRDRRPEDAVASGFPRPHHSVLLSSPRQTHLHLHTQHQYSHPYSSTSPVDVHDPGRGRRASSQLKSNRYSPILQTQLPPTSSSLPTRFPSLVHPSSVSPTDLLHSAALSSPISNKRYSQRSPVLPGLSDARMFQPQLTSASSSPTVQTSGLSGLDVLVQAATEERERIDVHRRLSGGEEPQSSSHSTSAISGSAPRSPVELRSNIKLQDAPPTPPYSASFKSTDYLSDDGADAPYKGLTSGKEARPVRLSPEPSRPQQRVDANYSHRTGPNLSDGSLRLQRGSRSPETAHSYERKLQKSTAASHLSSANSTDMYLPKPDSSYIFTPSPHAFSHQAIDEEEPLDVPALYSLPLSPLEPVPALQVRRSPPRSKLKPKKPGSAALAVMEKEFRGVALSDRVLSGTTESKKGNATGRSGPLKPISFRTKTEERLPDVSSRSRQSNERGAGDDDDVDDFFLSTFDSPRDAERRIPSQTSEKGNAAYVPSARIEDSGYAAARWSDPHTRLVTSIQQTTIKQRSPSTDGLNEMVDHFSNVRQGAVSGEEMMALDVEAEIMDELVNAVGTATSEDEKMEFDDQETDNMDVDVDAALLDLIDGPSEPHSKSHRHSGSHSFHAHMVSVLQQQDDLDRMSMPPPDALMTIGAQAKDAKKRPAKPKTKAKANAVDGGGSSKATLTQVEDFASQKSSKSKSSSRPRPTKVGTSVKSNSTKASKESLTAITLPTTISLPASTSTTPTVDGFPVVTSSGRMVTKTKKSAAALGLTAPSIQPAVSQQRKRPVTIASGDGTASRSRSQSAKPRTSVDPEVSREKSGKNEEDKTKESAGDEAEDPDKDKLYCICRTPYDEDKVMIACDRCDEWYHTQCVNMPDILVDLVDQFICSNCISQNPNLRTTYKQRCFAGLNDIDPDSPDACHKPSRGAFSKYCSDECGVRYMHRKIQTWARKGGDVRGLWESVKDTKRREGFVTSEPGRMLPKAILGEIQIDRIPTSQEHLPNNDMGMPDDEGRSSIVTRLEEQLQSIVHEREEYKKELEVIGWRQRLLQLASVRADSVGECGWDQRLVYGDEEWLEFGAGVLESYDDTSPNGHADENQSMDVDGQVEAVVGEWWCRGKKKCERHMGWQRVRAADIETERVIKERALADLTRRERDIRSRIEDILHPQSRSVPSFSKKTTFNFKFADAGSETIIKPKRKSVMAV